MTLRKDKDRRKLNVKVANDLRGEKLDRRRCPECDFQTYGKIKTTSGGTVQYSRCFNCGWIGRQSKQISAGLVEALISFEAPITRAGKDRMWIELDSAVMNAAGKKDRKRLSFKAVIIAGKKPKIRWIVE